MSFQSLNELFECVELRLKRGESLEFIKNIVQDYVGNDWTNYMDFNHDKYVRTTVYVGEFCEILIISWKVNQKTPIHDHPEGGCVMKVLSGTLIENTYSENNEIHLTSRCLNEGSLSFSKGKKIVHQINAISDSVSLHIYSPPNYVPCLYI